LEYGQKREFTPSRWLHVTGPTAHLRSVPNTRRCSGRTRTRRQQRHVCCNLFLKSGFSDLCSDYPTGNGSAGFAIWTTESPQCSSSSSSIVHWLHAPFRSPVASSSDDHLLSQRASDEYPLMLSRHPSSICRFRYGTPREPMPCSHAAATTTPLHDTPYLDNNTPLQHPLTCTRHPEKPETKQPCGLQRQHLLTTPLTWATTPLYDPP